MSFPVFPPLPTEIPTEEEAKVLIKVAVALSELALAHLINGEAEKAQAIAAKVPTLHCAADVALLENSIAAVMASASAFQEQIAKKIEVIFTEG